MASIKEAMLIRESVPDAEITIFFNDIRAAGKGFEELYLRAMEHDIRFIRGFPARIEEDPETKNPILWFEEMVEGTPKTPMEVDFVVLAGGVEPDSQTETLAGTLGIARDDLGFLQERHSTWGSIETTVPGIFMAGGIQGPKDIPESVAQASGAAARALALLNRMKREAPSRSSEVTKK
jgi:heterodisulfide reductase subunit A